MKNTIDGVEFMSRLSGLSKEEITWMITRTKELYAEGKKKDEVVAIVKAENPYDPRNKK